MSDYMAQKADEQIDAGLSEMDKLLEKLTAAEKTIAEKDAKIKELEYINAELKLWRSEDQSAIEEKDHKIVLLEQQLKEAESVIGFYADRDSWVAVNRNLSNQTQITTTDVEDLGGVLRWVRNFGGKLAREYLSKKQNSEGK